MFCHMYLIASYVLHLRLRFCNHLVEEEYQEENLFSELLLRLGKIHHHRTAGLLVMELLMDVDVVQI